MDRLSDPRVGFAFSILILAALAGCTQVNALRKEGAPPRPAETVRVLLMPLDVELAELTAGGLAEPHADWTQAAQKNITEALRAALQEKDAVLVHYAPVQEPDRLYRHEQFIKLHNAVSEAILFHRSRENGFRLVAKHGKLDWSLGEDAKLLREGFHADYALFITVLDTYSSGGRALLSVVLSALYLFPVLPGSGQQGLASLVDLRDGSLVWFNRFASQTGDLRTPEGVRAAMDLMLKDMPL